MYMYLRRPSCIKSLEKMCKYTNIYCFNASTLIISDIHGIHNITINFIFIVFLFQQQEIKDRAFICVDTIYRI